MSKININGDIVLKEIVLNIHLKEIFEYYQRKKIMHFQDSFGKFREIWNQVIHTQVLMIFLKMAGVMFAKYRD